MKASELIKILEILIEENGDLPVTILEEPVEDVEFLEEFDEYPAYFNII